MLYTVSYGVRSKVKMFFFNYIFLSISKVCRYYQKKKKHLTTRREYRCCRVASVHSVKAKKEKKNRHSTTSSCAHITHVLMLLSILYYTYIYIHIGTPLLLFYDENPFSTLFTFDHVYVYRIRFHVISRLFLYFFLLLLSFPN